MQNITYDVSYTILPMHSSMYKANTISWHALVNNYTLISVIRYSFETSSLSTRGVNWYVPLFTQSFLK